MCFMLLLLHCLGVARMLCFNLLRRGWMDGWIGGWTDGKVDVLMDEWMDVWKG